jgi:hypothetical protein
MTRTLVVLALMLAAIGGAAVSAQDMPDPSQIHGRALPAPELAAGTVTVRVVRESIGNDIAGQQVQVTIGGATRSATTDAQGRAEFTDLTAGGEAVARATVDGEALESQPFAVPTSGGLRVILVAGIAEAAKRRVAEEAAAAALPPTRGTVTIGGDSRVHIEFNDDQLRVFYLLEIVNTARTRVDIGGPIILELPRAAQGASLMPDSAPTASVSGDIVTVTGPFASGTTNLQVGYTLDFDDPEFTLTQVFPVAMQQVLLVVQKNGAVTASSPQAPQVAERQAGNGTQFIVGEGPTLPAGSPLTLTLTNLPTRSKAPRYVALALSLAIAGAGIWLVFSGRSRTDAVRALEAQRGKLMKELEQLEVKQRTGTVSAERYASRKHKLVTELESIYAELDELRAGPQGGGEGIAA